MITKEQARSLAICYNAYHEECEKDNALGMRVWARLLIESQIETGVDLMSSELLQRHAAYKKRVA